MLQRRNHIHLVPHGIVPRNFMNEMKRFRFPSQDTTIGIPSHSYTWTIRFGYKNSLISQLVQEGTKKSAISIYFLQANDIIMMMMINGVVHSCCIIFMMMICFWTQQNFHQSPFSSGKVERHEWMWYPRESTVSDDGGKPILVVVVVVLEWTFGRIGRESLR